MSYVFEQIARFRVVPVIAIESTDAALPLADALIAGGLPIAEITFRTAAAADVIRIISRERPEIFLGAGTLLNSEQLKAAREAGARFGVAPGLNPQTVEVARQEDFPFIPGVCTPSEVEKALSLSCNVLKFFPAGAMGGVSFLKSLIGPYGHTGVKFMPTGGITIANLGEYLELPAVVACGGTWIASKEDIATGQWDLIAHRCKEVAAQNCPPPV